jgi:hypothetical protein
MKLIGRLCKACRAQREREEREAAAERHAERAKNAADQERKGSKVQKRHVDRLPDRSRFEVQFDAATETWSGTLTISVDGGARTFTAAASGFSPSCRTWTGCTVPPCPLQRQSRLTTLHLPANKDSDWVVTELLACQLHSEAGRVASLQGVPAYRGEGPFDRTRGP